MKAIVLQGEPGKAVLEHDRPYPQPRSGYVLVDVKAVALNPTDWKHIDYLNEEKGTLSGCDFAGVVAETGSGYSKQWKVGDRICGFAQGANKLQPEDGAFAERIAVKADIAMRVPDDMSFEDAATGGVGVVTCGQGLVYEMGLNRPSQKDQTPKNEHTLIYGGSSSTGVLGIQFAKLAGYIPITTCSASNFDLVKALGAAEAFDYKDPKCIEKIQDYTNDDLKYVWDTIGTTISAELCSKVLSSGGTYGTIVAVKFPRTDVKTTWSIAYTAMGEPVQKTGVYEKPGQPAHFEFAKGWIQEVDQLLAQKKLKVHQIRRGKGLEDVFDGMDLMRKGKVSGQKLVYTL